MLTPIDSLFLLLPYLTEKLGKLSPYDQLVSELGGASSLGRVVTPALLKKVCTVSDCMGDDMLLYKIDEVKVRPQRRRAQWGDGGPEGDR